MKKILALTLFAAWTAPAAIVDFNLSPPGTDSGVGLSPLNEVPPASISTGSGGEITPGVFLDTVTRQLGFAIGYGSSAGFTDLTGPATAMHFHGPATTAQNAGVVVGITPSTRAFTGNTGGSTPVVDSVETHMLAGRAYFNIHSKKYPGGEIRGQVTLTKQ